MTFARGATLSTGLTLGHAETSNLGPTAGNGFYRRWPDDLAMLQDMGVSDVRLTLDWPRLQPKPGDLDLDWVEQFDNFLSAASAIGLKMWGALYDGAVPKWLDNEGGLDDEDTITTWWPRWVERVADRFGDRLDGWIPFHVIPDGLPLQPWRDTWRILEGGDAPVVASVDAGRLDSIENYLGLADHIGVALGTTVGDDDEPNDQEFRLVGEQFGEALRTAAELANDVPLVVSEFAPHHNDPDIDGRLVELFVEAADAAVDDGIDISVCFLDPAIAGPGSKVGLVDKERTPQPSAAAYLPSTTDGGTAAS